MALSLLEQETIINYNNAEKEASVYTCDPALMTKLERLAKRDSHIKLESQDKYSKTYSCPKKTIKIHVAPKLSEEERQRRSKVMSANLARMKEV